jgi:hypothetical protein
MQEKQKHKHVLFVPFVFVDNAFVRFIKANHLRVILAI